MESMESVLEPRDRRVDPAWWSRERAVHERNRLSEERRVAEGEVGPERGLYSSRFYLAWISYSAGDPLESVVAAFRSVLVPWSTCITTAHLREYDKEFPALAHLCGVPEVIGNLVYPHPGPSHRPRFAGWLLGDAGALESDFYTDPPNPAAIDNLRVDLVRLCQSDPVAGAEALEVFVREQWYPGSEGEGWWGLHRPNRKGEYWGYQGYWCWEAAAVAKIFDLDDSGLEGHEYHPSDIAHYLD